MIEVDFKTLESGWIKRTSFSALKEIFLNPVNLFFCLLSFAAFNLFPLFLFYFLTFISINANYSHFYKLNNNSSYYFGNHYLKTLSNIVKCDSSIKFDLFVILSVLIILSISQTYDLNAIPEDNDNVNLSLESNIIIYLFSIILPITILFFSGAILFITLSYNIFYYILMKSNKVFEDFRDIEIERSKFFRKSIGKINKSNKNLIIKLFFIFLNLLIFSTFISFFLNSAFPIALLFNFYAFWLFFIVKELVDGKPEEVKVKSFETIKENS